MEHPMIQGIRSRTTDILQIIEEIDSYWTYDLLTRKPSPAEYDDAGNLIKATNLDLATFLYALADRGAMINIPEYKSRRNKSVQEGTMIVSEGNRHGKLIGLVSNKEVFSFGLRIIDMNVMSEDQIGFPRSFMLTDFDGSWYKGWKTIEFMPSAEENKFLSENKLWDMKNVKFDNFVVPEKWLSFYGKYYFITKAAIDRLAEENQHLKAEKKRLLEAGITLPSSDDSDIHTEWSKPSKDKRGKRVQVDAFEVEVDLPEREGEYEVYPTSQDGLVLVCKKLKTIRSSLEKFRFATRCVEYAASKKDYKSTFPAWIKNVQWEEGFKFPGKRKLWNRLKIIQPGVAQYSIAIRTRWYSVTQEVAEDAVISTTALNASTVLS